MPPNQVGVLEKRFLCASDWRALPCRSCLYVYSHQTIIGSFCDWLAPEGLGITEFLESFLQKTQNPCIHSSPQPYPLSLTLKCVSRFTYQTVS